jgi:large subunit ribosomal protein L25
VKCLPSKIPEVISLDVTGLGVGDSIHVYDVDLGEGVDLLVDPERTICSVQIPKIIEVEEEEPEDELEEGMEEAEGEAEEEGGEEAEGDSESEER